MGCGSSKSTKASEPTRSKATVKTAAELKVIDTTPPPAVKEIRANDQLVARMRQVSAFKCEVVGLMTLHNHLVHAREAMKAQEVLIFDISQTSELQVDTKEVITILDAAAKDDADLNVESQMSLNKSFTRTLTYNLTEGGPGISDNLGLFRCRALDLSQLVLSK